MNEEVLQFGKNKDLIGIITSPADKKRATNHPVFIFLNSGFIHRVGFSRVHVEISRKLAQMGFVSFRMDSSGIGDSLSRNDNLQIDQRWVNETREAMDVLSMKKGSERFVLIGNCSGAELSFNTACVDQRVVSAVLINPTSNRILLQYYIRLGLFMPSIWLRLIKGKLKYKYTFQKYLRIKASDQHRRVSEKEDLKVRIINNFKQLTHRGCRLFMIHCEWDANFSYYRKLYKKELADLISENKIKVATIKGMNHDFFLVRGLNELIQLIQDWSLTVSNSSIHS